MKTLRNPYFLGALVLFAVIKSLAYAGIRTILLHSYGNDVLCLPVVLTIALAVQRHLVFRQPQYIFSPWHVLFTFVYCTWLFEWFLPGYSSR
ncbi:MAG: hypothetical protein M3Q97_08090, partial [Bacteroidota bacterium]|nr:hypothetical protein [Bacteroidota bacterium]